MNNSGKVVDRCAEPIAKDEVEIDEDCRNCGEETSCLHQDGETRKSDWKTRLEQHVEKFLKNKQPGQVDSPEVQVIKGLIRRGEARAAARLCGIPENQLHFLDMPFYETGKVKKKPLSDEDVKIIVELMRLPLI